MSYTYHGSSSLIALPGEVQRIVNGDVIVIEKDYAIRKDRLASAIVNLSPGNKMPGTDYIIDAQPQFQFGDDGFVRVRFSSLNLNYSEPEFTVEPVTASFTRIQPLPGIIAEISFGYAIGSFSYKKSIYDESQDPEFTDIVAPTLLSSRFYSTGAAYRAMDFVHDVTFGPTQWRLTGSTKTNLYENRAFLYNNRAICAPTWIRFSSEQATIQIDLQVRLANITGITNFTDRVIGGVTYSTFLLSTNANYYGPTVLFGDAIEAGRFVATYNSDLEKTAEFGGLALRGFSATSPAFRKNWVVPRFPLATNTQPSGL